MTIKVDNGKLIADNEAAEVIRALKSKLSEKEAQLKEAEYLISEARILLLSAEFEPKQYQTKIKVQLDSFFDASATLRDKILGVENQSKGD